MRTALCFSMALGLPVHVTKIRAGRRTPGLRPQHAATLMILADICSARLKGVEVGSTEVTFSPGEVRAARGSFDLGTAASITLVLQAVIPAVSLMGRDYEMELVGGTDVPWSPTSDYLENLVAPAMSKLGLRFSFKVERRGYYPKGGGKARVRIEPCESVRPVRLDSVREGHEDVSLASRCGKLPVSVAERQANAAATVLSARGVEVGRKEVSLEESTSPGSSMLVWQVDDACFIGGDSIGARGKPAETVGREAAENFLAAFETGARVDAHLADMLAPLLCLSGSPSALLIPNVTEHLRTSLAVATQFAPATYSFSPLGKATLLTIRPREQNS